MKKLVQNFDLVIPVALIAMIVFIAMHVHRLYG